MESTQTEFDERELLADHPLEAPLIANGILCHGGFDEDGNYFSPRTLNRSYAITSWSNNRAAQFGTDELEIPLESWPEHYPNVAQSKYLIGQGVRSPFVSILTRIGTVEGFGAVLRTVPVPDLQKLFDEEISGTALSHLSKGLFEAHGRDEAGFEEQAGHSDMWFAARDIAFENPPTQDETERMLSQLGVPQTSKMSEEEIEAMRARARANRLWNDDVSFGLENLFTRMARILLIEIQAFHTFAWAEELLSDSSITAGDGEAAKIVSYIRQDESPHVGYLRCALSEARDRTIYGKSGRKHSGSELIGDLMRELTRQSLGPGREQAMKFALSEVEHSLKDHPSKRDILEEFHALGSTRPGDDGNWESTRTPAAEAY